MYSMYMYMYSVIRLECTVIPDEMRDRFTNLIYKLDFNQQRYYNLRLNKFSKVILVFVCLNEKRQEQMTYDWFKNAV